MSREFCYGDEVTGQLAYLADGLPVQEIKGVIASLDWGPEDEIVHAVVRRADGKVFSVVPDSLQYQVDRNGFAFRYDKRYNSLTVLRNDNKLLDPKWVKRTGVYKLCDSMAPGRRRKRAK